MLVRCIACRPRGNGQADASLKHQARVSGDADCLQAAQPRRKRRFGGVKICGVSSATQSITSSTIHTLKDSVRQAVQPDTCAAECYRETALTLLTT